MERNIFRSISKKWFINRVFPGACDVLASLLLFASILISDDLPTLERPINAYSGNFGSGHLLISVLLTVNSADFIIIISF